MRQATLPVLLLLLAAPAASPPLASSRAGAAPTSPAAAPASPRRADPAPTPPAPPPPAPAAPYVKVPATLSFEPGDLVFIPVDTNGKQIKYVTRSKARLVPQYTPGQSTPYAFITSVPRGSTHCFHFYTALGDVPSDPATCLVTMGGDPTPPPTPTPPVPPVPPTPPVPPAPTTGSAVLILYESADVSKYPAAQQEVLFSKQVRDWLNAHTPLGPDGKTHAWRIYDKDVDATADEKPWPALLKAAGTDVVPALIVGDADGKVVYKAPLPGTADEALKVLGKYLPSKNGK